MTVLNSAPGRARASGATPVRNRNRLLASLSPQDFELLEPNLTTMALNVRQVLEKPNRRIENVYFMDTGITSVVAVQTGECRVEVGLIGCEGMSGTAVVLGAQTSPHESYIQVAGEGQQITTGDLERALAASNSLHAKLLRYVQVFMVQTAQTAIANARANVDERLARWILMAHDRVTGNTLPLTHEFLALMLGVRRAGVTEAVHKLAEKGLIEFDRGQIIVCNRKGIERHASDLYGVPEAEYRRLIG